MDFFVSGKYTVDVGLEYRRLSKEFNEEVGRMLASAQLQSPLTAIVLFPTILNPAIAAMPDHVTFKRGEKAVFAGTNIAHKEWVSASKTGKIRLLADSISASLKRIKAIHLPSEDLKTLLVFVELVTHALNAKHQN